MRWPRRFVSFWWLTLIVVSCLVARPLHEAMDLMQAGKGSDERSAMVTIGQLKGAPSSGVPLTEAGAGQGDEGNGERLAQSPPSAADRDALGNSGSQDSQDGDESQPSPCAWCLMLAGQAHAPSGVPVMLVQHAEASPPPVALQPGLPMGRCALAAAPRGPPLA